MGVTSAVSDESVAGDSGVYEPSERRCKRPFSHNAFSPFKYVTLRPLCLCSVIQIFNTHLKHNIRNVPLMVPINLS